MLPLIEEKVKPPEPMDVDDERYKIKGQRPSQKGKGATNEQNTSVDQKPPVEQQRHTTWHSQENVKQVNLMELEQTHLVLP